jgi:hypothetical protein
MYDLVCVSGRLAVPNDRLDGFHTCRCQHHATREHTTVAIIIYNFPSINNTIMAVMRPVVVGATVAPLLALDAEIFVCSVEFYASGLSHVTPGPEILCDNRSSKNIYLLSGIFSVELKRIWWSLIFCV